jgi:hypothetical protein
MLGMYSSTGCRSWEKCQCMWPVLGQELFGQITLCNRGSQIGVYGLSTFKASDLDLAIQHVYLVVIPIDASSC